MTRPPAFLVIIMDILHFPLQGISLYKGFPFARDFPLQGISLKGFPFIRDLPLSSWCAFRAGALHCHHVKLYYDMLVWAIA